MVLFGHGEGPCLLPRAVGNLPWLVVCPFQVVPAEVLSPCCACGLVIDLFPTKLPNVRKVPVAIFGVEAERPGVAQPPSPNLWSCIRVVTTWIRMRPHSRGNGPAGGAGIVFRDGVGMLLRCRANIDPKNLAVETTDCPAWVAWARTRPDRWGGRADA